MPETQNRFVEELLSHAFQFLGDKYAYDVVPMEYAKPMAEKLDAISAICKRELNRDSVKSAKFIAGKIEEVLASG